MSASLILLLVGFATPFQVAATPTPISRNAATTQDAKDEPPLRRTILSGRWSDPKTWEEATVPKPGDRVQIRTGHVVIYDQATEAPLRSIHVAGTLRFDPSRNTRLDVGLIKIQAGDDPSENGFACEARPVASLTNDPLPALEVGTAHQPIPSGRTALIRLTPVPGLDPDECPAIICCGARLELHGTPLSRTWVKLGRNVTRGDTQVQIADAVDGWKVGDLLIVTASNKQDVRDEGDVGSVAESAQTEERRIRSIQGQTIELDRPLVFAHRGDGEYRAEVANLSRNVVIESSRPESTATRGHTLVHSGSSGSISYAEFRHLGKPGKLGKYTLHFHRVRETLRGFSVLGASFWDSGNRWVTVHGTDHLLIRDCVGYKSQGHGFFLEDGTEMGNILDRNLAVQALGAAPLPDQILPYDRNEGAGFWWANSGNSFTRNVAVECDQYGFRYDVQANSARFDPVQSLLDARGERRARDIREVPFVRFEANEVHSQRRYGVNLGGGPGGGSTGGIGTVGPDDRHPSVVRRFLAWETHWALTPAMPGLIVEDSKIAYSDFGLWRPRFERQAYKGLSYYRTEWPSANAVGFRPDDSQYPRPFQPVDDQPPTSIILGARIEGGKVRLHGVAVDGGTIEEVRVNGTIARLQLISPGLVDWNVELTLPADRATRGGGPQYQSEARDAAGNVEANPHRVQVSESGFFRNVD